jgi:plastocyanin
MKSWTVIALSAAFALLTVGCMHTARRPAKDPLIAEQATAPTYYDVAMLDFHFKPESLNVVAGDTVTWTNHGEVPHTTTSGVDGKPDGLWDSGHVNRGNSFSYVLTEPGTYRYYCTPHWRLGMKGVIVVAKR